MSTNGDDRDRRWLLGLTVAAVVLYTWQLGGVPLRDWDEGTIAQVAVEMRTAGTWLHPTLYGGAYLNKPPLVEWLIQPAYALGGITAGMARLVPAIVSALAVPLMALVTQQLTAIGRQTAGLNADPAAPDLRFSADSGSATSALPQASQAILGQKQINSPLAQEAHDPHRISLGTAWRSPSLARWAAIVYLTLLPASRHGRLVMRDGVVVTLFLLFVWAVLRARRDRRWGLLAGIALGGLILTKGILALLLGGLVGLFLLVNRQGSLLRSPIAVIGLVLGLLPAIAWYATQGLHYGDVFWQRHFLSQSFDRVWTAVDNNQSPMWYYGLEILENTWPWLLFWPGGLGLAWQGRSQAWAQWVLIGTSGYLGAISVMTTKLPWYIHPLYPFFALAVAAQINQMWCAWSPNSPKSVASSPPPDRSSPPEPQSHRLENQLDDQSWSLPQWIWVGGLGLIAIAAVVGGGLYVSLTATWGLIPVALCLGWGVGLAAWWLSRSDRRFAVSLSVGLYLALLGLYSTDLWLWELNEDYPVVPVAAMVRAQVPPTAQIWTAISHHRPSLDFYAQHHIPAIAPAQIPAIADSNHYVLANPAQLKTLPPQTYRQLAEVRLDDGNQIAVIQLTAPLTAPE